MFATKPEIVVLAPEPVMPPGLIVHDPVGKAFNTTDPVATKQVGCVMVPTVGGVGVAGCALIITLPVALEVQPKALVTV